MTRRASGLRAWVLQRVTAIYLAGFFLVLLVKFLVDPPADQSAWRQWVADPWIGIAFLVFVVALLLHAWVGVRDVLMDYVQPTALRVGLLALLALALMGCGLWGAQILILARMP